MTAPHPIAWIAGALLMLWSAGTWALPSGARFSDHTDCSEAGAGCSFILLLTTTTTPTLKDKLKHWNWDLMDIVRWARDTAIYWIDRGGVWAYLAIAGVCMMTLLSWDLTRQTTSLVMARTYSGIGSLIFMVSVKTLALLAEWTGSTAVARARDALRFMKDNRRRDEDTVGA